MTLANLIPANVKMQDISHSSNVEKAGYDDRASDLYIEYKGGGLYRYAAVPLDVWRELQHAPSIGKFIHAKIKKIYAVERLDKPAESA